MSQIKTLVPKTIFFQRWSLLFSIALWMWCMFGFLGKNWMNGQVTTGQVSLPNGVPRVPSWDIFAFIFVKWKYKTYHPYYFLWASQVWKFAVFLFVVLIINYMYIFDPPVRRNKLLKNTLVGFGKSCFISSRYNNQQTKSDAYYRSIQKLIACYNLHELS